MTIARVALDVPLDRSFDFRVPEGLELAFGSLVVVPFGRATRIGVVMTTANSSEIPCEKLRAIERVVDDVAPLTKGDLELLAFCASYYQRPIGEVIASSLPPRLRQVRRRAIRQAAGSPADWSPPAAPKTPNAAQTAAIREVLEGFGRFHPVLLAGVTGSGKTEVYLRLIAEALARGLQSLYLVPEIGLTPQLEMRVRERFPNERMVVAHSNLGEGERAAAWLAAQSGSASIVLGTRLAALMPMPKLGLVIVDEEHDPSYKQHEGLRYSARDVAVRRAQLARIPVVLGSATPSLESWANAKQGRYGLVEIRGRALAGATLPKIGTVDTRAEAPSNGLSQSLLGALRTRLQRGEQSLVFLNRRGYSPVLYCRSCAWHSACERCSANLVFHQRGAEMRCHHCGRCEPVPKRCPTCGSADLSPIGHGTQRIEESLRLALPNARIARIDRDSTTRKGALAGLLSQVREAQIDILIGTQMLAKGHDYPMLTLVGVLDSDAALFSADFRAGERLFALLTQVAGRAGRADQPGEVLIQTDFPTHPLYAAVAAHDFASFADRTLEERRLAGFPPFTHLALLRAESRKAGAALAFLSAAAKIGQGLGGSVEIFDPVPAPLERKAGYERAQLLVRAASRPALQPFLRLWKAALDARPEGRVRGSLDVDPQES